MEIAIAWITMAALILLVLGIIDPGIALFWSKGVKTRKRAAMIYGFVFFVTVALSVVFFPGQISRANCILCSHSA